MQIPKNANKTVDALTQGGAISIALALVALVGFMLKIQMDQLRLLTELNVRVAEVPRAIDDYISKQDQQREKQTEAIFAEIRRLSYH